MGEWLSQSSDNLIKSFIDAVLGTRMKSQLPPSNQLNLKIPSFEIDSQTLQMIFQAKQVFIEIYASEDELRDVISQGPLQTREVLLERWILQVRILSDSEFEDTKKARLLRRWIILLRTVFTTTRFLPLYRIPLNCRFKLVTDITEPMEMGFEGIGRAKSFITYIAQDHQTNPNVVATFRVVYRNDLQPPPATSSVQENIQVIDDYCRMPNETLSPSSNTSGRRVSAPPVYSDYNQPTRSRPIGSSDAHLAPLTDFPTVPRANPMDIEIGRRRSGSSASNPSPMLDFGFTPPPANILATSLRNWDIEPKIPTVTAFKASPSQSGLMNPPLASPRAPMSAPPRPQPASRQSRTSRSPVLLSSVLRLDPLSSRLSQSQIVPSPHDEFGFGDDDDEISSSHLVTLCSNPVPLEMFKNSSLTVGQALNEFEKLLESTRSWAAADVSQDAPTSAERRPSLLAQQLSGHRSAEPLTS